MKGAEYIRMSTDFQRYSTENQRQKIREYAAANGIEVVRTYLDEGRSGLSLRGRPGLQSLLADVAKGTGGFEVILVFDVSRWGRFQDLDEGAHYEYVCRAAGMQVVYCAESFQSDLSPYSSLMKGLKRIMAGEYSRELSEKTFTGQSRLARLGYRVGGAPGYGYRRLLLDSDGNPKGLLGYKERKARQEERIVLIPGPQEEVQVVREIFRWFVEERLFYTEIVSRLERAGVAPPPHAKRWTKYMIRRMLSDEKYVGHNVYNRTSGRLRQTRKTNPEAQWVRHENAFAPIVEPAMFAEAVRRKAQNPRHVDPVRAENQMRALLAQKGRLSVSLMRAANLPNPTVYEKRFGSLLEAYTYVGYNANLDYAAITRKAWVVRRRREQLLRRLIDAVRCEGGRLRLEGEHVLEMPNGFRFAVLGIRMSRRQGWRVDVEKDVHAVLAVRWEPVATEDQYFLLPVRKADTRYFCVSESKLDRRWGKYRSQWEQIPDALIGLAAQHSLARGKPGKPVARYQ